MPSPWNLRARLKGKLQAAFEERTRTPSEIAAPRPGAPRTSVDVVAYCGSWVDEIWIRSTVLELRRREVEVLIVVSGNPDWAATGVRERYAAANVPFRESADFEVLGRIDAKLLFSASTTVQDLPLQAPFCVHMPHSLASLHMIYPADAFDGFDALLACGPHHEREFRALSKARELGDRPVWPGGYGKLDVLRAASSAARAREEAREGTREGSPHVLLAPSWGPHNLLDALGEELCAELLARGARVTLRPHPLFVVEKSPVLERIRARCGEHDGFDLELSTRGDGAMFHADVLVTDYSGTAFEFAALRARPSVFVDVPLKEMNPEWRALSLEPVEVGLRARLGALVEPRLEAVADAAFSLAAAPALSAEGVLSEFLYPGACGVRVADTLCKLLEGD